MNWDIAASILVAVIFGFMLGYVFGFRSGDQTKWPHFSRATAYADAVDLLDKWCGHASPHARLIARHLKAEGEGLPINAGTPNSDDACTIQGLREQLRYLDSVDEFGSLIHYPDHWDTAAYPTLKSAIHEVLSGEGCSECNGVVPPPVAHGSAEDMYIADAERLDCPACGGSGHIGDVAPASAQHAGLAHADSLSAFEEGQWWVHELDGLLQLDSTTMDQKRAVFVVHHLLRAAKQTSAA